MADYFELLSLPPRAVLDDAVLQQAYLKATRTAHPDQAGGDALLSADLNAALETLESPVTRLKHLIDQHSQTAWRAIPLDDGLMGLFEKLGPLLQQSTAFLARKQAATSALAKALLSSEEMRLRESLESLNEEIEVQWQQLEAELPASQDEEATRQVGRWRRRQQSRGSPGDNAPGDRQPSRVHADDEQGGMTHVFVFEFENEDDKSFYQEEVPRREFNEAVAKVAAKYTVVDFTQGVFEYRRPSVASS